MTTALTEIRTTPGLDPYLDALEARLERAVEAYPGVVAAAGEESLAAGGKRLRPARRLPVALPKTARSRSRPASRSSCCTWPRSCTTT